MLVQIMHAMSSSLQVPVIILLIAAAFIMVILLGMLVAELFTERRYFNLDLPELVDDLAQADDPAKVIEEADLLRRQKQALLELLRHPSASDAQRESLAVNLVSGEKGLYDNRVKVTDFIAKVAPMLGLMGTLIPLGPGIVAIGQGDTAILSESLLIAFDTTVLGLIVGAVALLVSTIRKSWYTKYMAAFDAAMECVLERANEDAVYDGSADTKIGWDDPLLTAVMDSVETQLAAEGVEPAKGAKGKAKAKASVLKKQEDAQ